MNLGLLIVPTIGPRPVRLGRAGFTLAEVLVASAVAGGVLLTALALLGASLSRRVRMIQDERDEQRSRRAMAELREALLSARNTAVFASRADSSNAALSVVTGRFLRVERMDGVVLGFEFVPEGEGGSIRLHRPDGTVFEFVSGVMADPGGAWVTLSNGLPEASWWVSTPVESVNFHVAAAPRGWR